ncbi:MAG: helicase-exonuclease AddAB subunit AddA [Lachnospiraceae bacterium]|nr:helicase-exonuclease AddAB subunit AddA [Lachnospiraceae bacterium]
MSVEFTPQQKEAIDLRDCNILVSAAAGSGKTAVLTERIVNLICDEAHPVDADRLLVVTFTSAAAAEMRERIANKLGDRVLENPGSERLQRQMTLLHNAQITTIDSFCLFLIKNHFNEIGLDPAFRVADEREIKLLQQETLAELLEDAFAEGKPEFHDCVEILCPKGREKVLEEQIVNLSRYAASFPWPEEWLEERKKDYQAGGKEALLTGQLRKYFLHYAEGVLDGCVHKLDQAIRLAQMPDGPYVYGELLDGEKEQFEDALVALREMQEADVLEKIGTLLEGITFGRLPSKKDDSVDADKRDLAKDLRDEVKKILGDLREQFFVLPGSVQLARSEGCSAAAATLIDLVLEFDRRMREKKQEKKLIDFNDMEHFALDVLLRRENGKILPTQVARQYREYFHEILIDEYQDSNLVQEYLLRAVSGEEDGHYNRFMVGDVKQSIYHFRLARPELFMEKYLQYQKSGRKRRIDLSKNFRSRKEVIDSVNNTFRLAMSREVGGIDYDEDAALYLGASYPVIDAAQEDGKNKADSNVWTEEAGNACRGVARSDAMQSELLLVEKPGKDLGFQARQAEALAIAERIRDLLANGKVTDAKTKELRPVRYRDVVILLRTLTGWGDAFKAILEERGIPAYVTSKSGYFTATEVQTVLNFLRVIDNPLQDVPLFGVLHSDFGGFSEEEIAMIRGGEKERSLYECLCASEEPKAVAFLEKLHGFRERSSYLTIRTLLETLFSEYDYLNYVTALPGGSKRRANLEMLLVKASDFEKTSYFGLFHFLRYIEMLEKYEEDYGEAETLDENADVVRIMSIHKSKGLEFPVTIVAGLAKKFNLQDASKTVILDADLGLGMDFVDPVRRFRSKTLRKIIVAKKLREDTLSEELRLLYVAMTRAKEKLILTAEVEEPGKVLQTSSWLSGKGIGLSYLEFMKANSYLDFLEPILNQTGIAVREIPARELIGRGDAEQLSMALSRESLARAAEIADPNELAALRERFAFQYPRAALAGLYTKTTVSELKIAAMSEKDEAAFHEFEEREEESYVPEFRRGAEEITGTVRGNAYHRVMELLDLAGILRGQFPDYETFAGAMREADLKTAVDEFLKEQTKQLRLSEEYRGAVRTEKICKFLRSRLGYRMLRAQADGKLYREQPFVLAIPATRLKETFPEEETVLIQGIIDAYFIEEDGIVLLDYKTDSIASLDALWQRYETQMDHYQEALERLTGKRVKERVLYSFHFDEASSK